MSNTNTVDSKNAKEQDSETPSGDSNHDTTISEDAAFAAFLDAPVQEGGCLDRARKAYSPLGVPDRIIGRIAVVMIAHETRLSAHCNTPKREAMGEAWLTQATDLALGDLLTQIPPPLHITVMLAKAIRDLAPEEYDAWVDTQSSGGVCLSMCTTRRDPTDLQRERLIEECIGARNLPILTSINPVVNLVGILRPKLEAELGVKTSDEQTDLDLLLKTFLLARRTEEMGEALVGPRSDPSHVTEGLKLLDKAQTYDRRFNSQLKALRTRIQKRTRKIQVGVQADAAIKVEAPSKEEAPQVEAVTA